MQDHIITISRYLNGPRSVEIQLFFRCVILGHTIHHKHQMTRERGREGERENKY